MLANFKFKFLLTTALSLALLNGGDIHLDLLRQSVTLNTSNPAYARRSGGRSGGGSFSRSSSNSRRSSSASKSRSSYPHTTIYRTSYYGGGYGTYSAGFAWGLFWIFFVLVVIVLLAAWLLALQNKSSRVAPELENNTVTVSKLQIALLAEARSIQSQLSVISLDADTETAQGLSQLLQESVLALLRSPEKWQYVLASSQKVARDKAEAIFTQLSIQERSNFSAETLVNVAGRISQKPTIPNPDIESAAYIVVTLLIGTAHDHSLFAEIRTPEALKQALEKVAAIPPQYLLKFELLWSPQIETDSLTYEELLTDYTDMMPI